MSAKVSVTGMPILEEQPDPTHGDLIVTSIGEILIADDEGGLVVLRGEGGTSREQGVRYELEFLNGCSYVVNPAGLNLTLTIEP